MSSRQVAAKYFVFVDICFIKWRTCLDHHGVKRTRRVASSLVVVRIIEKLPFVARCNTSDG